MKFFKRKIKKADGGNEKLAGAIARAILKMQSNWAAWMQRQSERLSHKRKKMVLICCCIITVSYSAFVIVSGVWGDAKMDIKVSSIKKPTGINPLQISKPDTTALKSIHLFRHYTDSLAGTPAGRQVLDSLRKARPGLMDSLDYVERMYQSQSKK